jgi:hypothetical protein
MIGAAFWTAWSPRHHGHPVARAVLLNGQYSCQKSLPTPTPYLRVWSYLALMVRVQARGRSREPRSLQAHLC